MKMVKPSELTEATEKKPYKVATISAVQKGNIVEARVAELITLYGDNLACYRPISDDEGIDLIVKEKGSNKWDAFMIDRRDLACHVIKQLGRV
jgi:hypothetical protein